MTIVAPNYFTCSLGQAAKLRRDDKRYAHSFSTIIELIDGQARDLAKSLAVGFASFKSSDPGSKQHDFLTFKELSEHSKIATRILSEQVHRPETDESPATVGLLCTSSFDFLFTSLGLMRLGFSVLFLAPQLEPRAIQHLCETLKVRQIFVDERDRDRVKGLNGAIEVRDVPNYNSLHSSMVGRDVQERWDPDVAYYCHTSGTSSGLPKPIPQTHFGLVGALPSFKEQTPPATFSTTPLYHGGFVDCYRAWTSGAMVWFFPEGLAPVTGANLLKAISFAKKGSPVPIKYFSSVPYVLQMLAEENEGIQVLQTMDLVGVGGAALPEVTGNKLVESDINLLSRLGSAECGFLMSSHRNYAEDKDWQYLRPVVDSDLLSFEPQQDGLSELVVRPGWPFKIKTNREDGSYATADLFAPHPSIPNAWRYHSRADAQITLANGKKFDPSPMEESLRASTQLLQDVLIFGSSRDYPGALLFPKSTTVSESKLIDSIWPQMEKLNAGSQNHARISRPMLIVVPAKDEESPLEKSSKGTILRRKAEERYGSIIESAYEGDTSTIPKVNTDEEVLPTVLKCFYQILGRELHPDKDLYRQGVDSLACIQVRKLIESSCLSETGYGLPMNVIYDQGTINELAKYVRGVRNGKWSNEVDDDAQLKLMDQFVEKYSNFKAAGNQSHEQRDNKKAPQVVLLTGATGFLGAHILHLLRQDPSVDKIYCLLRAQTPFAAHERVSKALSKRGMPALDDLEEGAHGEGKVICLPCNLHQSDFGLSETDRTQLRKDATLLIHSAWTVNFTLRLRSFEDQVAGSRNLINLATEAGARFVFISSTAAVTSSPSKPIPEKISTNASDASPLGYSRSKWVTENVCAAALDHLSKDQRVDATVQAPMTVIRVGQLCSNDAGHWNASEAYPLMLSTATLTGCLPDLPDEVLNWMPGELAAQAVLDIALTVGKATALETQDSRPGEGEIPVYHVLNYNETPTWKQMLEWISAETKDPGFEIVSPSNWVEQLEAALKANDGDHPAQALLGLWKDQLGQSRAGDDAGGSTTTRPKFDVSLTCKESQTMRELQPLSQERVLRMWKWIRENVASK